jgi:Heterokaryon incompatibility protein (HET)
MSLNDNPVYLALSYVWGELPGTSPILPDGRVLHVSRNLTTVLLHLRHQDLVLTLWIDAILLNQKGRDPNGPQLDIFMSDTSASTKQKPLSPKLRKATKSC